MRDRIKKHMQYLRNLGHKKMVTELESYIQMLENENDTLRKKKQFELSNLAKKGG